MNCLDMINQQEPSPQEIKEAADQGNLLLSMEIEFSLKCNFKCVYCYLDNRRSHDDELTKEELCSAIIQAKNLGAKTIIILGGEPMIYPQIMEMLQFIIKQDLDVRLFTNGSKIKRTIAKKLFDLGVTVVLKMNSFDEKTQDMLSGKKGAYRQIQSALKTLREAGYPGKKKQLIISTIICRQNYDEILDMWQWSKDRNIIPYFEMITPQGMAKENHSLAIETEKIKKIFYQLSEIDSRKYDCHWTPHPPLVGKECFRHQYSCTLNSYGDVLPCIGVTIPIGNVKTNSLESIIKDSDIIGELKNYKENIRGPCGECEALDNCYGCRGAAYQMTGDYLASDPLCWKNTDRLDDIVHLPLAVEGLVPHMPPMCIVDELLSVDEKTFTTRVKVSKDSIFVGEDGVLDEVVHLEILAQSMAAWKGFKNLKDKKAPEGYLIGVKGLKISGAAKVGDTLSVSIHKVIEVTNVGVVKGKIFKGDELITSGEIKIWDNSND
jgi:radical SAM protein with 4Fe4S-binding SPASM domain